MKKSLFLTAFLLIIGTMQSFAANLDLFIVQDDTDPGIGAVVDFRKVQDNAKYIAEITGLTYRVHAYTKTELKNNPEKLSTDIRAFTCGTDDVVWFYYSGHGFNEENGSRFGAFSVDSKKFSADKVESVFTSKNPRLLLVMYDACNWTHTVGYTLASRPPGSALEEGLKRLFIYSKGTVKVASNTAGYRKFSYGDAVYGGLFTRTFSSTLMEMAMTNNCTWEGVLQSTKNTVQSASVRSPEKEQVPYYEANVRYLQQPITPPVGTPDAPSGKETDGLSGN
jgi:Caspase domain